MGGRKGKSPAPCASGEKGAAPPTEGRQRPLALHTPRCSVQGWGGVFTPLPGGVGKPGSVNNQTVQVQDPRHDGEVLTAAGTSLPGQWTLAISHGLMSKGQGGEHI